MIANSIILINIIVVLIVVVLGKSDMQLPQDNV
jgi:hypothetical protein